MLCRCKCSSSALIASHASNGIPPEGEAGRIPKTYLERELEAGARSDFFTAKAVRNAGRH